MLLKEVFDQSLEEIAGVIGSTTGGVKAALHRGRSKLAGAPPRHAARPAPDPEAGRILSLYVDRFNRRDWDGLRELIAADARLRVADCFAGRLDDSPYFANYARFTDWRLVVGDVDGERAVIILGRDADAWRPRSAVRLDIARGRIQRIVDHGHCPWVLRAATSVLLTS